MRILAKSLLELTSQPRLTLYLGALWGLHIWGSIIYLAPGADDAAFISQALGFINRGDLEILYIDRFQGFYINLPGYAFAQSLFYWLWDKIGLPINFATYKLFHLSVVSGLMILTVMILKRTAPNDRMLGTLRANVFLLLIPITPFVIDVLSPRPEAFGLLAIAFGVLCFQVAENSKHRSTPFSILAAFCFGVAMTAHPMFVVVGSGLCLSFAGWLWFRDRRRLIIACIASAVIPVAGMAIWFANHSPESIQMMQSHVGVHSPNPLDGFGSGLLVMLNYTTLQQSQTFPILAKLFYAVCYGALTLILASAIVQIKFTIFLNKNKIDLHKYIGIVIFVFPFIYFMFSFNPKVQVFTMLSYCFVLSLVSLADTPARH